MADNPFGDQQDQRPVTITLDGPVEVKLINELITALQTIVGPGGAPVSVSGSGAGEMTTITLMRGRTISGDDEPIGLEDTREVRVTLHGDDEANNIDTVRTDPNRIIWNRPHEEYISVPSVEIPAAEGDLWNPAQVDTVRYLVEFNVVNNDVGGADVEGVYVGRDLDAGGALAAPEYWMYNETIPHPGQSGWRGPYYMHGDDAVRGVAAVANDASIHFRVRRVDTGA